MGTSITFESYRPRGDKATPSARIPWPRLIWMDLEMTGLDPERHVIVEIATLVTDDNLAIVAEGPDLVVSGRRNSWMRWTTSCPEDAQGVGPSRLDSGLGPVTRRRRPTDARLHQGAREGAGEDPALWQLDRCRSAVPSPLLARNRRFLALPLGRRLHGQGAVQALVPIAVRPSPEEGRKPPGPRRHPEKVSPSSSITGTTSFDCPNSVRARGLRLNPYAVTSKAIRPRTCPARISGASSRTRLSGSRRPIRPRIAESTRTARRSQAAFAAPAGGRTEFTPTRLTPRRMKG